MIPWFPATWQALLADPVFQAEIFGPLGLILADLISGIMSASHRGEFSWQHLSDFLSRDILKYIGGLGLVLMSWFFHNNPLLMSLAATVGMGSLGVSTLVSIYQNLREFFSKVPLAMVAIDAVGASLGYPDASTSIPMPDASPPSFPAPLPMG